MSALCLRVGRFSMVAGVALAALAFGCHGGGAATAPSPNLGDSTLDAAANHDAASARDASSVDAQISEAGSVHLGALIGGTGNWPGFIAGVAYQSGNQSGTTDAQGAFHYQDGVPVSFTIAGVSLRAVTGAAQISSYQLAAQGACSESPELERLLVLLDSLDADGDLTNGIAIGAGEGGKTTLAALTDDDLTALVAQLYPGRVPTPVADAVDGFIRQMDAEVWMQVGIDTFTGLTAEGRSEGCATDGQSWYFSWRLGLEHDDFSYNAQKTLSLAIPAPLALAGESHIGDIDLLGSTLYAPIEDSGHFVAPKIVLYDAATLTSGAVYSLSNTLLTHGVPWVAVDGPRQQLYVAQADPAAVLLIHDLSTVTYQRSLPLTPPIHKIQGAKVYDGMLYASADDTNKTIYKINLETGTAISLFTIAGTGLEEEGICFVARPDGSVMHTLVNIAAQLSVEFHHHKRTRDPLRDSVCP